MKSTVKLVVSAAVAAAGVCAFGATTYTWDTEKLTGDYFDPASWKIGTATCETFAPANNDTLSFTGGHVFEPSFAANAGRLSITGMWSVAANNTLKIAPPTGTEVFLGDQFGVSVGTAAAISGVLDLSGKIAFQGHGNSDYGDFKVHTGSTIDIHGAGTVFGGIDNAKGMPGINGTYGQQDRLTFIVRDGATVTNVYYRMSNCVKPVFAFSGSGTVVRNFKFVNGGSGLMKEGVGYFTNGVLVADCPDLNFSGYTNTVYIDDATITNTALSVAGDLFVDNRSRFYGRGAYTSSGSGRTIRISGGSYMLALGANPGLKVEATGDSEMTVEGEGTVFEVLANGNSGGIARIGTGNNSAVAFKEFQSRVTVKDGAKMVVGAVDGQEITSTSHVGINLGATAGGIPSCNNEILVANGGIVTNLASTLIGGGYQAYAGSNNRLIVSNATFYSRYGVTVCDSNVKTGYPSTNNWVEVVDGASFRTDSSFWLGKSGTNCGNARCRVVNSEFYSGGLEFYTQDASLGGGFFEVGGTNGHANVHNLVRQSSGDLHLKFSVPEGGQTSGKPYIDVRYSLTMSIPEAGVTADLNLNRKWATSGRKNFVDLMRISRGGSATDYPKQSARLTTIMNSIPKESLKGATLSIVTNTSDTVFSNNGTYTLRLNAGPRQGLMLLVW